MSLYYDLQDPSLQGQPYYLGDGEYLYPPVEKESLFKSVWTPKDTGEKHEED